MHSTFESKSKIGVAGAFPLKLFGTKHSVFLCSYANNKSEAGKFPPRHEITSNPDQIEAFRKKYDVKGRAVYFCVNVPHGRKRTKDHIAEIRCLHVDIDLGGVVEDREAILKVLRGLKYPPTAVVFSGHGFHCYWLFKVPLGPESITSHEDMLRRLAGILAGDASAAEVVRVLRLPGSHNSKRDDEWLEVEVVEDLCSWKQYSVAELDKWLNNSEPLLTYKPTERDRTSATVNELKNWAQAYRDEAREGTKKFFADEVLDQMEYKDVQGHGIDDTHTRVVGDAVAAGENIDDVVAKLLLPTKLAYERGRHLDDQGPWDEKAEIKKIKRQYRYFTKKDAAKATKAEAMTDATPETKVKKKYEEQRDPSDDDKPQFNWPQPVNLWGAFEPPELPKGLLPPLIEEFAFRESKNMGCDPAGLAMSALTVCAAAIRDNIKLQVKQNSKGWMESTRLWAGLVGDPSTKKSPIMKRTIWPLKQIEARLYTEYLTELRNYNALPKEEQETVEPPVQKRLRLLDVTIESAQDVYKDNHDGLILEQDELSGWLGSMDKYSGHSGGMKDRGFWLTSDNGEEYLVDRVKRGSFAIPNLGSTILGGIQPDGIRKAAGESVDDGLIQRFFMIILKRATIDRDDELDIVNAKYGTLVELLYQMQAANVVRFSPEAQRIRDELAVKHIELQCLEGVNKKLSAHIGKYDGRFARLALLFHCIEHAKDDRLDLRISEDTAQRTADFLHKFLLPHALAFYGGVLNLSDNHERLSKVAGFILAHKITELDNRTIQRGDRTMRKLEKWETDKICETFEALGWAIELERGNKKRIRQWRVNPRVHTMFAERAQQEAKERAAIHQIMQNLGRK